MTRKCVLCKETNYRNTYSFFSAPKDPETRKKWQKAIAIENYAVTDDTYVCSKHFLKEDIITHWISGVPPHVITIKYKKCRLRPGAVPSRSYHLEENTRTGDLENSDDSDVNMADYSISKDESAEFSGENEESFVIPRTKLKLYRKKNGNQRLVATDYKFSTKFDDYNYVLSKRGSSNTIDLTDDTLNTKGEMEDDFKEKEFSEINAKETNKVLYLKEDSISQTDLMDSTNSEDVRERQNQIFKENSYSLTSRKTSKPSSKIFYVSEGDDTSTEMWEQKLAKKNNSSKEKSTDSNFKTMDDLYIKNELLDTLSYDHSDTHYNPQHSGIEKNEMLFEDLLEICTEVTLPRGWSCLVTSKGHTTTIVYLYMGMTKNGMPFTEKQVFVKSDMTLRCTAVNREINPLIHNLIREGKHLKVQALQDIEELIDEFDQRIVCQGVNSTEGFKEVHGIQIAYKDGIKWRHVLCPLLINNDSSRCTRCITLIHMSPHKSKGFLPFRYNPRIFVRKQQKVRSLRQTRKRTRKRDIRYEFVSCTK